MNLQDIQHLFAYTEWANSLVLDAAANLSEEQLHRDFQISYSSIFGTLLHNASAEWLWLERWQGGAPTLADWQQWSETHGADLSTVCRAWQQIADERRAFLAGVDETRLAGDFTYPQTDGAPATLPLAGQMQQLAV